MSLQRLLLRDAPWALLVVVSLVGCQTDGPDRFEPPPFESDFEDPEEEITVETVQREEAILQRAQIELRLGGAIPWDFTRPDVESRIDPAFALGTKAAFEGAKNLYFGIAFDWANHEVDTGPVAMAPDANQIEAAESFNKFNILATVDYDIPLSEADNPLLFRFGVGAGVALVKFNEGQPLFTLETFTGFVLRPSVGLRYHFADNWLVFGEASYDWVPDGELETNLGGLSGEEAVFSAGTFWVGVAYEWH